MELDAGSRRPGRRAVGRRRGPLVLLAVVLVAVTVAAAWWFSRPRTYTAPAGGPVTSTFQVPTYSWDGGSGMDALVSGTLWFTPEGCTLLSSGDGDQQVTRAVIFPDATGVTYTNGVRAVVDPGGDVYAVEGQPFTYGGGFVVTPDTDAGKRWLEQCPTANLREGALVNDHPATRELTRPPPAPASSGPTAPTSDLELGFFTVPTFTWDPATGGGDETTRGTITLTDAGCPTMRDSGGTTVGLVFPNAEGFDDPHTDEVPSIYSSFPNGTSGVVATHGQLLALKGVSAPPSDPTWAVRCASTPVGSVFYVHDAPFPVG